MSTDIEDYRILKPGWPRAIWGFNSQMSQAAYITETSQLVQSSDWVGQRGTCSMLFTYLHLLSLLSTEDYFLHYNSTKSKTQNL